MIGDSYKISPCCKTTEWHYGVGLNFKTVCRCERCDKPFDIGLLITVKPGHNPVTYYCDKCCSSLEAEVNRNIGGV